MVRSAGFGGSDGSVWVMGEWSVGQWIVGVIRFQKIFGLYGLKHQIVEISGDVRIVISALWVKTNSQIMDTIL